MKQPSDWDTASRETYRTLPKGGYVCRIKGAEETVSSNGNPMLNIEIDIAKGDYAGFFNDKFNKRKIANPGEKVKWPYDGIAKTLTEKSDGKTHPNFKNLVESVKESNAGWTPTWGDDFCKSLTGKYVGVVFRRREWDKDRWTTEPDFGHFKSVNDIENNKYTVPADKPYEEKNKVNTTMGNGIPDGFEVIPEEDVPF